MLKLIRKDLLLQKNMLVGMLLLLVAAINFTPSTIWVGIVFCVAIIMQMFSADEKSSIHLLLNSLPYSRKQIVGSKYAGAVVIMALFLMTTFLGHFMIYREVFPWSQLLFIACVVFLFISFAFPFSYLFKSQYLFIASGVLFVLYLIIANQFVPNLNDILRNFTGSIVSIDNHIIYLFVGLGVLLLYLSSWLLSIRIYSKKVF
ncbi:ABC-2 transporter permease [Bhargavaea ginsengi]|uniref:ABC-2 transporter permease n=1 Tax=Bhargavaea ginsengi TaxID=426757 RepID=UPI00203BA393|nr:ABC-2 transporter permease [Bhargavaea ginsengi]MCM3088045.1 ABC-2 transporter permease [Bhargavaea ginsengi]